MKPMIGAIIFTNLCALSIAVKQIVSPVILVPGLSCSALEMKLNKPSIVDPHCLQTTQDYELVWINLKHICPIKCFVDNMIVYYNSTTRKTTNSPGVLSRVPKVANKITPSLIQVGLIAYFRPLIDILRNYGYQEGVSLQVAAYDFRKGLHEIPEYWSDLKMQIKDMYSVNGNKRITLIGHSMGAPMVLEFLRQQTQEFKDMYINSFISLSGPFGGSFLSISVFLKGVGGVLSTNNDDEKQCTAEEISWDLILNARTKPLHKLITSYPALYWLFPSPLSWNNTDTLVKTHTKKYSLTNIQELFIDLKNDNAGEMYKDVLPFQKNSNPPGVEVHCIYGSQIKTLVQLDYTSIIIPFPYGIPTKKYGDGDGTVNINSLQLCKQWSSQQKKPIYELTIPKVNHAAISWNVKVFEYILKVLKLDYYNTTTNE